MMRFMLVLLFVMVNYLADGKVVITGKMVNNPFKGYIYYNEPIDGFADLYFNDKRVLFEKDSTFRIEAQLKKGGFFSIKLPGRTMRLFVNPNDTIQFEAYFQVDHQKKKYVFRDVYFNGDNAEAHQALALNTGYEDMQGFLMKHLYLKKHADHQQFLSSMEQPLNHLLSEMNELYFKGTIGTSYYKAVTGDLQSTFAFQVISLYEVILNFKGKSPAKNSVFQGFFDALALNGNLFTNTYFDSTKVYLYRTIYPLDETISYSFIGISYSGLYTKDILSGLVKDTLSYDERFSNLSSIEHFGYLKGRLLESLWKSHLYWSAATEPSGKELEKGLSMYAYFFPKSSFLPFLKTRLGRAIKDRAIGTQAKKEIQFVDDKLYVSLLDLVLSHFRGKYVFVDLSGHLVFTLHPGLFI